MKPQIEHAALDGPDAAPHLRAMAQDDKDKKGGRADRDAKLAQALRANLRRRKAGASPPPAASSAQKPDKSTTD